MFKLWGTLLGALTVVGMPLFAVLGGIALLGWLGHVEPAKQLVRFVAGNVFTDMFNSSILVTIPLFTFVGYLMAESKTPDRMVRAASAALGWLPGGLAIVCIIASAFFTTLTGGSGVTIVAIGGLLYPALVRQGYPQKFALGLVTTAGAIGLLFPPSPLVLIYSFVSGVSDKQAYLATLPPGIFLMVTLCVFASISARRFKVPTQRFVWREVGPALWEVKWEALTPVLVLSALATGLTALDESAAIAALYVLLVEVYVYKDLTWRKVIKVAKDAMTLVGAIILILAMATALNNYVIDRGIPQAILDFFVDLGMSEKWHFVLMLNFFLFILGMLMDAFSAMLVALPLLLPLAAAFAISPFYLAVMFLLNMELAYVTPPVGLNLYVASFRFRRPIIDIYRSVLSFVALLAAGLLLIVLFPKLSTFTVDPEIARLRTQATCPNVPLEDRCHAAARCLREGEKSAEECQRMAPAPIDGDEPAGPCMACAPEAAPRDAWKLECVQEDRNNPIPCQATDIAKWGKDGRGAPEGDEAVGDGASAATSAKPADDDMSKMLDEMMSDDDEDAGAPPPAPSASEAPRAPKDDGR